MGSQRPHLVVDSSVVVPACLAGGLRFPGRRRFRAPRLLWSEVVSTLHAGMWRGDVTPEQAQGALQTLARLRIVEDDPEGLADEAWRIADELGLAKTYDAEFLALARLRGTRLVTADARLHRVAARTGLTVGPMDL